jgi:Glycosyl hydrolases family 18
MRTSFVIWQGVVLAVVLGVLAGVGMWLSVPGTGASGQPSGQAGTAASPVSADGSPVLDLQALPSIARAPRPANCAPPSPAGVGGAWLPDWLDDPSRPSLIADQASKLRMLDFFWLGLGAAPDSIESQPDNPGGSTLATVLDEATAANPCGLRFVTISDERTPMSVLANILTDPAARWRSVAALAAVMAAYPQADGLTLDYEYALPDTGQELQLYASVAHWHGLSAREEIGRITADFTEFVRELALAMHRQHAALRVAVRVRTTDEIDYADQSDLVPFLYDYGALARYADQIVLMAVDFHWAAGEPGPIVTLSDLRSVLREVQTYGIPGSRLAVESPAYGYDWAVDPAGHRRAGTEAATVTATDLATRGWPRIGSADGETYYQYTADGQRHAVWFGGTGLKYQAAQLRQMCPGCAVMAWATGNTDPAGSALIEQALSG